MKIGDECYVHGYVDEIRNDTIIIRNDGGYFGTAKPEVLTVPPEYVRVVRCKDCKYYEDDIGDCIGFGDTYVAEEEYCSRARRKEE